MVDLNTNNNFTEGLENLVNSFNTSDGSIDELSALHKLLNGEGIDGIIEGIAEESPEFAKALKDNKNKLQAPDVNLFEISEESLVLPEGVAKELGLEKNTTVGEFLKKSVELLCQGNGNKTQNFFGIKNLNSEMIDIMCMLLCQDSRSKIIETLKEALSLKNAERQATNVEYLAKSEQVAQEQVEAAEAAEKAKKMSIFSAILNAILAVVITAISIVATVASCGASALAIGLAAVAITASIASTAASLTSAVCTIVALETDDPEMKKKLDTAVFALGIASAALGLVACGTEIAGSLVTSLAKVGTHAATKALASAAKELPEAAAKEIAEQAGKNAAKTAINFSKRLGAETTEAGLKAAVKSSAKATIKQCLKESGKEVAEEAIEKIAEEVAEKVTEKFFKKTIEKSFQAIDTILTLGATLVQSGTSIASGVMQMEQADIQKQLDDLKIQLEKLDKEIATLEELIKSLTTSMQEFMEEYLKAEEEGANVLSQKGETELELAKTATV